MTFDLTINVGNILTLVAMLIAGAVTYGKAMQRIGAIETKVDALWHHFIADRRGSSARA